MSAKALEPVGTKAESKVRSEATLLQAGALQNAIFNSANFSSIATDAKGVIQIFNVGAERMLGYTAAEVMNKITPADISDPQEVIARAKELSLELGTQITPGFEALVFKASRSIEDIYELTYIRKDGSSFPAVVSVTALRDEQDAIIGYLLIGTDNTARKQAEEALQKAGALQNAIFNSANFSSIATDAKGVIQIFNVGAERMLGYTAGEVMNKITPADISDPQEVIARAKELSLELGTPITPGFEALVFKASRGIEDIYELTYIRKDGSRFPAVVSVTALRDEQDAIIGYLLIGTDNTARKQIEAEQKQLSQRLRDHQFYTRSLFESNIDAIMTTDPFGIITDVNKQMEVLTGCTRDELSGAPFKNYFTDPDQAETVIKLVLREKKVTDYELTVRARDGVKTVVSFNAATFYDRDRKLQGVFAAARDVTERKRYDQMLQEKNVELENAKAVAEKANLSKSEFLSSMSHELRSPLNAILGFAQLLETGSPQPTTTQKSGIDQILKAGWYLLELINEILDLALIESGRLALSLEPISLLEVMHECQAMIEPQAQKNGIHMSFPQLEISYFVNADRTRVKQVLINLLSNAIKYNRPQGAVEVKCSTSAGKRIRISVRDTGEGLTPEQRAQLFQPFNRLGQESSTEEGTGIGLVVSKRLVELMGGEIAVESTVGVGSTFWFELNLAAEPQPAVDPAEPLATQRQEQNQHGAVARTLLYVEDNQANLKLVEQLIARRPDLRLLSAGDGLLGIETARTHQPDVILMDINLPGMSGIQALKILREDPVTARIPVLAISANAMPHDISKGLEAGFFRYLTKPIKVDEFMDALNLALELAENEQSDESGGHLMTVSAADILKADILIVDDQKANVLLLEQMLKGAGYTRISSTGHPDAVCQLHRDNHYDLILLDLQMPGMDGFEVMEGLKEIETEAYLPVLAITVEPTYKLRALQCGAKDFISKPFDQAEVLMRVHNFLEVRLLHEAAHKQSQMLELLALNDPLTGLANRRLLSDRMSFALSHARRNKSAMAVVFLDLDGFKQINDTFGHGTGDILLKMVAERLVATVREEDTVARLGGDEFIIALWHVSGADYAATIASRAIEAVSRPYTIEGNTISMTTSAGVSIYPAHGEDADTLMKRADSALYEAKAAGKNVYRVAETVSH